MHLAERDTRPLHLDAAAADAHPPAPLAPLRLSQPPGFQPASGAVRLQRLGESWVIGRLNGWLVACPVYWVAEQLTGCLNG
jgi:hypothetical protein